MKLDLLSFRYALASLERSLNFLNSDMSKNDPALHEQFRNSAIQCFEFTHEIAFKFIKRQLEQMVPNPTEIDKLTYMDLIRTAAEAGLLLNVAGFKDYRDKRNITSHTYDQSKAEIIETILPAFRDDMLSLLNELDKRNR